MSKRFQFGKNWMEFSQLINKRKIIAAEKSFMQYLNVTNLEGKNFLDIGTGSGLFSLAAHNMGAEVDSFDYDMNCVLCAKRIKEKFDKKIVGWNIEQGDVLQPDYMRKYIEKKYDVVYSWGVLHHTGNMKEALEVAGKCERNVTMV